MKVKKIVLAFMALLMALTLIGCSSQSVARNFGGTYEIDLPAGRELEAVTWKDSDLWILTKKRPEGEDPETHYYSEDSTFGILEGEIVIREH